PASGSRPRRSPTCSTRWSRAGACAARAIACCAACAWWPSSGERSAVSGAREAPRYTGVRTFAGLDHLSLARASAAGARAAVVGVPFDTATSWRPGARFGPEAIRSASSLLRPWHPLHSVDVFAGGDGDGGGDSDSGGAVVDGGDIATTPGNAARTTEQVATALAPVCAAGV